MMKCYNCGSDLTEHNFCTNCGADVGNYKLVVSASNIFYNEGLEKAAVRDLSGAVVCLRQCIKLNKNHVEARNLLGLVYFEQGEAIQALNEWVMSKNLRSKKNIADDYLNLIQSNPGQLDSLNAAIKKYNQALTYCYQGSLDLAVIQLKKVLSMNAKYVQAHLLLGLLYMHSEEWDKARKEMERVLKIDTNNTLALRYLQEINQVQPETDGRGKSKRGETRSQGSRKSAISDEAYQYQSGNETIIQPMNISERKGVSSVGNLLVGILVGVAVAWFLILPARVQNARAAANEEVKTVSEQLDAKNASINELESRVKTLETQNEDLEGQLEEVVGTGGTLEDVNNLLQAAEIYINDPSEITQVGDYLEKIDSETITDDSSEAFTSLYNMLMEKAGSQLGAEYYKEGLASYQSGDYEAAVTALTKAAAYDSTNVDAYFNLANSYRRLEKNDEAIAVYEKIIELFPSTERASRSQSYINELKEAE